MTTPTTTSTTRTQATTSNTRTETTTSTITTPTTATMTTISAKTLATAPTTINTTIGMMLEQKSINHTTEFIKKKKILTSNFNYKFKK